VHPVGISLLHIDHLDIGQRSRPSGECGVCLGTAEIRMEKKHKSLGHHQLQYSVGETMPKARKLFQLIYYLAYYSRHEFEIDRPEPPCGPRCAVGRGPCRPGCQPRWTFAA